MKHRTDLEDELVRQAALVGARVGGREAVALIDFVEWLIETNRSINLTAIREEAEVIRLHIVDSLSVASEVDGAPLGTLLDLGTGGGVPGVPLVIHTGRAGVLLDSVAKKVRVVGEFAESRGLPISTVGKRAEEHALEARSRYSVVVARAVTSLAGLVELASPLLSEGGVLVCMKGTPAESEEAAGVTAAGLCGLALRSRRTLVLPGGEEARTVVSYVRVGEPTIELPRRIGLAQHKPLA